MYEVKKIEENSPDRCQGINQYGQCRNGKVPGSQYCAVHGGNAVVAAKVKTDANQYRLTKYAARLKEFSGHSKLKSLKDEIAILRILIEEIFNRIGDDDKVALLQFTPQIADLVTKVEKLVTSCTKLDAYMGQYLDKTDAAQFGLEIVRIIGEHVTDTDALDIINAKIVNAIERLSNNRDLENDS